MRKRLRFPCSQSFTVTSPYNMKTILLLTALTFSMSHSLNAQWATSGSNIYYNTGNVGIGTTPSGDRLTVSGNTSLSGFSYLKTGQMYFQNSNTASNSYVRGIVGQNITWDPTTSQWYIPNTANPDFSAIRMEASGQMAFYTHPYDTTDYSGNYLTNANMLKYRRLTITPTGSIGIGSITTPAAKLDIGGTVSIGSDAANLDPSASTPISLTPLQNSAKLLVGWNRSGGAGEVDFIGNRGGGATGGFNFYDYSNTGTLTNVFSISGGGSIGIGTPAPQSKLHLIGNQLVTQGSFALTTTGTSTGSGGAAGVVIATTAANSNNNGYADIQAFYAGTGNYNTPMVLQRLGGNVGIGTANPQSLLSVNGTITAKQVTVTQLGWSDYVFEPSYKLRSLPAVESYIQANRHLPDVPSAAEVGKNGVDIGETQASLLRKIEELTLYAIAQEKQLQENAVDNKAQDNVIKKQQEQLQQQQQLLEQLTQKINLLIGQKK